MVTWLDREDVLGRVKQAVESLAAGRPEVEQVLVFGSFATGRPVPGSDVDLLVILEQSDRSFIDRIPLYTPGGVGIGVDVFPYTREEIERMLAVGNSFLRRAMEGAVSIYPGAGLTAG